MIQIEQLKFWCKNECLDIMRDISNMKKYTKDSDIIYNHFNKDDIEKILFLENVRLGMMGYKFQRTLFELIDVLNIDVIDELHEDYIDFLNIANEQDLKI